MISQTPSRSTCLGGWTAGATAGPRWLSAVSAGPECPRRWEFLQVLGTHGTGKPGPPLCKVLTARCVFSEQCSATTRTSARRAPTTDTSALCMPSAGTSPPASAAAAWPATPAMAGSVLRKVIGFGGACGAQSINSPIPGFDSGS